MIERVSLIRNARDRVIQVPLINTNLIDKKLCIRIFIHNKVTTVLLLVLSIRGIQCVEMQPFSVHEEAPSLLRFTKGSIVILAVTVKEQTNSSALAMHRYIWLLEPSGIKSN